MILSAAGSSIAVIAALLPWLGLGAFMAFGIRVPRDLPARRTPAAAGAAPDPAAAEAPGHTAPVGPAGTTAQHGPAGAINPAGVPGGNTPFGPEALPSVSIIVPARNEALNLPRLLDSLAALDYPDFEIIVVDDRSDDGTGELARAASPGNASRLRVLAGEALPPGWFGKPWACQQGADAAGGELLLFTDADTEHHPHLLTRAVRGLREDRAHALSLIGRQEMGSFGEKLVLPHLLVLIGFRYPRLDRSPSQGRWRDAIANGQYILVDSGAYTGLGGHGAVKGEVVEDMRLAQELVRAGHKLVLRRAEDMFSTRMYTSLRELVNGWTKNVAIGARQAAGKLAGWAVPGMVVFVLLFWVLPALVLAGSLLSGVVGMAQALLSESAGAVSGADVAEPFSPAAVEPGWAMPWAFGTVLAWAFGAWLSGLIVWTGVYRRMGVPASMALLFPVGAVITVFIGLRSALRGKGRIEWKGRRYSEGVVVDGAG